MLQVDYLPSRFDPCRHAEQYPIPSRVLTGRREMVRPSLLIVHHNQYRVVFLNEFNFHSRIYYWYFSVSLRKRTTSSRQEKDTDPGNLTGNLIWLFYNINIANSSLSQEPAE